MRGVDRECAEPAAAALLSKIGSTTMKAAPKKLPMIEPRPPMMTMNSSWNERSIENATGSHGAQVHEAPQGAGHADDERADGERE